MATTEKILSYADDTSLYLSNSDETELFKHANIAMKALYERFCANKLSLNASKIKYIILRAPHTQCNRTDLNISIDNTPLQRIGCHSSKQSTKFLGLLIDEHLSWAAHLAYINKKISHGPYFLLDKQTICCH